jgi:hypothetical protein
MINRGELGKFIYIGFQFFSCRPDVFCQKVLNRINPFRRLVGNRIDFQPVAGI